MSVPPNDKPTSIVLEQVLAIECPECQAHIYVPLHVTQSPDAWWPEKIMLSVTPDLSALWHHAFEHVVERANDSSPDTSSN